MVTKLLFSSERIEKSLDAGWLRNEVISDNVANVDTPGYKRRDVQFKDNLVSELQNSHINVKSKINSGETKVVTEDSDYSYRIDGNNVDIEREMAIMAENTLKYNTLIQRVSGQFNKIRSIIKGG